MPETHLSFNLLRTFCGQPLRRVKSTTRSTLFVTCGKCHELIPASYKIQDLMDAVKALQEHVKLLTEWKERRLSDG